MRWNQRSFMACLARRPAARRPWYPPPRCSGLLRPGREAALHLLLQSHRSETLRVLADLVGVEAADLVHVLVHVAGQNDLRPEAPALALVVEIAEHHRHVRRARDVIEARAPLRHIASP